MKPCPVPYHWSQDISDVTTVSRHARHNRGDDAALSLSLSAHNSLTELGFVQFIGITAVLMLVPLVAFFGTPFLWVILGCLAAALSTMWWALKTSWKRGTVCETLDLWPDHLHLTRTNSNGQIQDFDANPYWTRVELVEKDGPVPNYVTLHGAGRHVEIGAFLSEDERKTLYQDLSRVLPVISQVLP